MSCKEISDRCIVCRTTLSKAHRVFAQMYVPRRYRFPAFQLFFGNDDSRGKRRCSSHVAMSKLSTRLESSLISAQMRQAPDLSLLKVASYMFLLLLVILGVFGWRTFDPLQAESYGDDPHLKKPELTRRSLSKEFADLFW
jgi:hypothetical protein